MIVVEVDNNSIKVEGYPVNDLLESLNSLPTCDSIQLIVDRNMDHGKIINIMQIIKKSNCENISIQAV